MTSRENTRLFVAHPNEHHITPARGETVHYAGKFIDAFTKPIPVITTPEMLDSRSTLRVKSRHVIFSSTLAVGGVTLDFLKLVPTSLVFGKIALITLLQKVLLPFLFGYGLGASLVTLFERFRTEKKITANPGHITVHLAEKLGAAHYAFSISC